MDSVPEKPLLPSVRVLLSAVVCKLPAAMLSVAQCSVCSTTALSRLSRASLSPLTVTVAPDVASCITISGRSTTTLSIRSSTASIPTILSTLIAASSLISTLADSAA
ncbi:MAG: hypothetical protein K2L55_04270 [Muribaculaceae bacterium]|nr:hypothetical protein [Muribaculaceae bacterium]